MNGTRPTIAIVGMAGRFPGAATVEKFWENVRQGVESIQRFSDREPGPMQEPPFDGARLITAAGLLDGIEDFDADFFGISNREADILDPQQRVFLECAWEALENAGYRPDRLPGSAGIFGGCGVNTYLFNLMSRPEALRGLDPRQLVLANEKDYLATRIAYRLGLSGPAVTVQTACSTSLVAVHLAVQSLLNGECDVALAGGVALRIPQRGGYYHVPGGIESADGHCRAFDAAASGTVPGSGVGIVVLRRYEDALQSGDGIRALIVGSAINNDGSSKAGFTAPSPTGQAAVIAEALSVADVPPSSIGYVEAHGTGTSLGDAVELAALSEVFANAGSGSCAIASVKANVGHLDAAAGIAGLIKTVLAIGYGEIPPALHVTTPAPALNSDRGPFRIPGSLEKWPESGQPRRAGVSSFGIGGTNAHVVIEEAPPVPAREGRKRWRVLPVSAHSPEALRLSSMRLAAALSRPDAPRLTDVAFTLQLGRSEFAWRRAVICRDITEAISLLRDEQAPVNAAAPGGSGEPPALESALRPVDERAAAVAIGDLWMRGATVDWTQLHRDDNPRRVPLPSYPFERRRHWIEYRPTQQQEQPVEPTATTGDVDEELIALWEELLGESGISRADNFFDRNGDSLLATLVLSRVRERYRCEIAIGDFFENPTVEGLAAGIRSVRQSAVRQPLPPIAPLPPAHEPVISFAQQRLWFIDQLDPGNPAYNITLAIRVIGALQPEVLESALSEIMRRHAVLRTAFPAVNGAPVPVISTPAPCRLDTLDLSGVTTGAREDEISRLCHAESLRPFDLGRGPLFRAQLVRLSGSEHFLLIGVHHVVFDVWSSAVFFRELGDLYAAFRERHEWPLPVPTVQYADFAAWQRDLFASGRMADDEVYWKQKLAGLLPRPAPPADYVPPRKRTWSGAAETLTLTPEQATAVRSRAVRCGATPFMVLLAAYCAALVRVTGSREIVLGTDIANRNYPETETMIGFFVNQLVLRLGFSGDSDAADMVRLVKETALEAFAHQDLPFDRLVDRLNPRRSGGEWPFFRVKFVMRNVRMPAVEVAGLKFEAIEVPRVATTFDFVLTAVEDGESITLGLDYSTELYSAQTVRDFLIDYAAALDWVAGAQGSSLEHFEERLRQADAERRAQRTAAENEKRAGAMRSAGRRAVAIVSADQLTGER